jgi:hypothetical protein
MGLLPIFTEMRLARKIDYLTGIPINKAKLLGTVEKPPYSL